MHKLIAKTIRAAWIAKEEHEITLFCFRDDVDNAYLVYKIHEMYNKILREYEDEIYKKYMYTNTTNGWKITRVSMDSSYLVCTLFSGIQYKHEFLEKIELKEQ